LGDAGRVAVSSVGYVVAFGGGVISFVSPCVLPVVPSYLSTIAGLDLADPSAPAPGQLTRVIRDTLLFFSGFAAVFCIYGLTATALGETFVRDRSLLETISGGVVIAMAVYLLASVVARTPGLFPDLRFHPRTSRLGPFAAPIAGAAFGFGWTPCIGPVLASVVAVASNERGLGRGALLLLVYAAGLGFPFLVLGCAFSRLTGVVGFLRRSSGVITLVSAVVLLAFGTLLVAGRLAWVTSEFEVAMRAVGLGRLVTVG
jgi:cytochrome c-type biogenesis protein